MHWMIEPLRRYAQFSGRSRRREFWSFILFQWLVYGVLTTLLVFGSLGVATEDRITGVASEATLGIVFVGTIVLMALFFVAMLIPNLAVAARRMQDQDMPGLLGILLVIGGIFLTLPYLAMAVFGFIDGTRGENRYGPDPKAERAMKDIFD